MAHVTEVQELAEKMCGKRLVLPSTGAEGFLCNCVLVSERIDCKHEIFISVSYDRNKQMPCITYSKRGGHIGGIEQVEAEFPEDFNRIYIDYQHGLRMKDTLHVAQ